MPHVVRLLDPHDRACLEIQVPEDKLHTCVAMMQQMYPGSKLWIDGSVVHLDGGATGGGHTAPSPPAPRTSEAPASAPAVAGQPLDFVQAQIAATMRLHDISFRQWIEREHRATESLAEGYQHVRNALKEVDLMARGIRVVEFQEVIQAVKALNAGLHPRVVEERRSVTPCLRKVAAFTDEPPKGRDKNSPR